MHWDIIELLVVLGCDFPSFDPAQVIDIFRRHFPSKSLDACGAALWQMASNELLQVMPRGSSLHILGLSEVLKAREDAICSATGKLTEALQSQDSVQLRQATAQLVELFRQIGQQLDQDRHAILELTERAKSKEANLPIGRRYSRGAGRL